MKAQDYTIVHTSKPSKKVETKEEIELIRKKALNILIDELKLNGHLKTGN